MGLDNRLLWSHLNAGTVQAIPDLAHHYWIVKTCADAKYGPVVTYQALRLAGLSWASLGNGETYKEAKAIAEQDWQLGFGGTA